MSLDDIPTPVLEVGVFLFAGAVAVSAVVVGVGAIYGGFRLAWWLEGRAQERNAETTRGMR